MNGYRFAPPGKWATYPEEPCLFRNIAPKKEKKMYKIYKQGKRFNTKMFENYEEARQYVRRWTTKQWGMRINNLGGLGFTISR